MDHHPDLKNNGIRSVIVKKDCDRLLTSDFGVVGWGGNSGFHAINLAIQFGVSEIFLVGFDMRLDKGVHWHGLHKGELSNPTDKNVARWRRVVDDAAIVLNALEIKVVNCSLISNLMNYPKMNFEQALGE